MAKCPNKNLASWKSLANAQGENIAQYLWDKYDGLVPEEYNTSLQDKLVNGFLKDFGVTATEYNNLKEDIGLDAVSAADLIAKAIAYQKGESITPEVAYFAYNMLGKQNNKVKSELRYLIYKWDKYNERFDYHKNAIKDREGFDPDKDRWKNKIRELVILDFLQEKLQQHYLNPKEFIKSLDTKWTREDFTMWNKIVAWFENVLSSYSTKYKNQKDKLNNLGISIADEILNKNYEYFNYDLKEDQIRKYYKQTIESDAFAKDLVEFGQKELGIILTGSLALRRAGEVYRTADETLHDIDWVIPYDLNNSEENKTTLENIRKYQGIDRAASAKMALSYVENLSWFKKFKEKYPSYQLINGFYGNEHDKFESLTVQGVINGEFYDSDGYHTEEKSFYKKDPITKKPIKTIEIQNVKHSKGDWIKDTGYVIDFFVRLQPKQEEHENYFKLWKEIMIAKLKMGRDKDFIDWKAFAPYLKSIDSFNFNYEGFRHINYESFKENAFEEQLVIPYSQIEGMPSSKASEDTLVKVKEAAAKMGINIQDLLDYAKSAKFDTTGINGLADLIRGVVAVAHGLENVALTEEMVHLATAILEQTNPRLITELISKIDKFKIYKTTLDLYSKNKDYQLANGKPDIRKIKKEAVDKLIVELIIHQSEGSTEFPELMEEETRSMIQRWWDAIKNYIRELSGKTKIDLLESYKEAAAKVISGDVGGTVADIKEGGLFYQLEDEEVEPNPVVDAFYDKMVDIDSRMVLNLEVTDASGNVIDPRHYKFDGTRVAKSITQKLKEAAGKIFKRTPLQIIEDDQKKDWGTEGHDLAENYIKNNLIDEDGYALKEFLDMPIATRLEPEIQEQLEEFFRNLVRSYPKGTRFLIERKVVNTKVEGLLASKVDFKALIPIEKSDGTPSMKIDTLDWKFTTVDLTRDHDIPWYKKNEWIPQMGEYVKIDYNYGATRDQVGKSRMVPFVVNYDYVIPGDSASGLYPASLEIGKLDTTTETNLYLLPVPLPTESTGNPKIDKLLVSLRDQWDQLYKKQVPLAERDRKTLQMSKLSDAIRILHLKLDFEPLVELGKTFLNNVKTTIDGFEDIDYSELSEEELENKMNELLAYTESARKFILLDEVFLSEYAKESLNKEQRGVLLHLEQNSASAVRMLNKITEKQKEIVVYMSLKLGIATESTQDSVLAPEAAVSGFFKTFLEAAKLAPKLIKLAANIQMRAKSITDLKIARYIDEFEKILLPLEKLALSKGKKAFDLIGTSSDGELKLIKKLDKKFIEEIEKAKSEKNRDFFTNNMDVTRYNELAAEVIAKGEKDIDEAGFSAQDAAIEKEKLRNLVDFKRMTFNGYNHYHFRTIFREVVKEEGHYSEEYAEMSKNEAALNAWKFFTALNLKAKKLGYLGENQGLAFFPLIEASILQKFNQSKDKLTQAKQSFWTDLYKLRVDEEQSFSKMDPETGKVRKETPKHFTRTNKAVDQLSTDLNRVGILFIKSLLEFETARKYEAVLLTLEAVQETKGSLKLDDNGYVVRDETDALIVDEDNDTNLRILKTINDDFLYGLHEDTSAVGASILTYSTSKFSKTEEGKQEAVVSVKKALKNADTLVRALAVGLKPLIAIANWAGYNFQAFISGGNMYTYKEFTKNNFMITSGIGLSTMKKALLNLIHPLNEDIAAEQGRKLAGKQSFLKYLSTWTFTDVMMVTNSFPEKKLQLANALSFNDNSMVVNGEIVNIRQHLKEEDRKAREAGLSYEERKALEKSFESRVTKLQETSSLDKVAELKDDRVIIPGVSDEELAKYRVKIIEYGRGLNGQMNSANKAGYRRDSIVSSFMMFKTWIPKLVVTRAININKNIELGEWEYGRARAFLKTWIVLCNWNVNKLRDIYLGTDAGLALLDELLESKQADYLKKTGQTLDITREEFHDLMRKQISDQFKELGVLFSTLSILLAAKIAAPDDDDEVEKNNYKFILKMINKVTDEISFYYDPRSADAMSKGSLLPALGLLSKIEKIAVSLSKLSVGYINDDEKMMDSAHVTKYFFNIVPGAAQFNSEILPYLNPELAKQMGIRVSAQSRIQ